MVNSDERGNGSGTTVGLCGLGNMGAAIASRLTRGHMVLGYDIDEARWPVAEGFGVRRCRDVADLAEASVVVLCLPSPAISQAVVAELSPHMAPGSVIVETSTVNPSDVRACATVAARHKIGVIDAAIAAGVGQMTRGVAALLVGGDSQHMEKAWPVLDAMSAKIVRLGALGGGAALKVINNAVAHAVMVVLVEAAAMATAAGVPRERLIELMTGDDAGLTRPLEHRLMERIAQGDYDGGMPTEAARKDSTLALELAQSIGVPLFAFQATHTVYEIALAEGLGRLDYASIATLWEEWIGQSLSTPSSGVTP